MRGTDQACIVEDMPQREKQKRTQQRIAQVRTWLKEREYDYVVVSNSDTQINEYVADRWKGRSWLSGFEGSNGTLVIGREFVGLWTDVRYYLIAEVDLKYTDIELFKMNDSEVPSVAEWLAQNLQKGEVLALNGKETSSAFVKRFLDLSKNKQIKLDSTPDVLSHLWSDRPAFPVGEVYSIPIQFAGFSGAEKLAQVRAEMKNQGYDYYLLGRSDEFNWLFNIKGTDIKDGTAIYCYSVVSADKVAVFGEVAKFPRKIQQEMIREFGVEFYPYDEVYSYLRAIREKSILIIPRFMNYALYKSVDHLDRREGRALITDLKAIKNETEISHLRECLKRDGVAMVKAFKWVDDQVSTGASFTEWDVLTKIDQLRSQIADYAHSSFQSIVGYNGNGALNHYMVSEFSSASIQREGVLLIDAGGTYLSGTSDTTRVLCLGTPSAKFKREYTTVLRALMALMRVQFPRGATGAQLDGVCRSALWNKGLNFGHSTGHGVGYGLEVHEEPQGFSHRCSEVFKPGMLTTIEPGLYRPNEYGIRLENMVICKDHNETDFGPFYNFENITFCPFDCRLIDTKELSEDELDWFNQYQADVYKTLSPHLELEEKAWLAAMCAYIDREE